MCCALLRRFRGHRLMLMLAGSPARCAHCTFLPPGAFADFVATALNGTDIQVTEFKYR